MKKLLRKLLFLAGAAMAASILFLLLLDSLVMPYLVDVPRVSIPQLRGMSVQQAKQRLSRSGLRLAIDDSMYHETIPAGMIVDQDPAANRQKQSKKGRRISVDISRGRRFYAVPAVREKSLREASLQLEANQLTVGEITYVSSADIPQGAIISATPAFSTMLSRSSPVDLEISNGSPSLPKRVPSLHGLPIEQVEDSLRKYEMRLGDISSAVDNDRPVGTVLEQSPTPRQRTLRLTRIDLVVSVRETTATELDTVISDSPFPGGLEP